jgi:CcmD family protein
MPSTLFYLILAYGLIWAVLFGYLMALSLQVRALRDEVRLLRSALEGQEPTPPA